MRDYALDTTFDLKFTTRRFTTGVPFVLAGSPVISAYPNNSTTQLTAGITLSVDFDGVVGLNNVRVVATSGNGYAAGTSYSLVITTGTVDSVSVVGEVVGEFDLERGVIPAVATIKAVTDNLERSAKTIVWVTVGVASSTTSVVTSSLAPAATVTDQFKGRILIFAEDTTTTALRGQATDITANTAGGVLTVTALTTAPASGDIAVIV